MLSQPRNKGAAETVKPVYDDFFDRSLFHSLHEFTISGAFGVFAGEALV